MQSERYLEIMRPVIKNLLRQAENAPSDDAQTKYHFETYYGVGGVTQREYIQAVKWLVDAFDRAQVIVRFDAIVRESAGGDDATVRRRVV